MSYKNKADALLYYKKWYQKVKHRYSKLCIHCQNSFQTRYKQQSCCSLACAGAHRKNTVICLQCGRAFYAPPSKKRRFCSQKCFMSSPAQKEVMRIRMQQRWADGEFKDFKWPGPSAEYRECCRARFRKLTGNRNHMWKGGISKVKNQVRKMPEYKKWRNSIFERDNYTCLLCGGRSKKGCHQDINADHHPIAFAKIIAENNIENIRNASVCTLLWDINNGRTLCLNCHKDVTFKNLASLGLSKT